MLGHIPEFDRGIKRARFAVLRLTQIPAILVEGGFISNKTERSKMLDPQFRQVVADSIARGIIQFNRRLF